MNEQFPQREIVHEDGVFRVTDAGQSAELLYLLTASGDIDFYRTFVPPAWRGQGVGEWLVRAGLDWARQQGYRISASCWYVQKFM